MDISESLSGESQQFSVHPTDSFELSNIRQHTAFFNSLRWRGYAFILLVLVYMLFMLFFFFSQREQPLEQLEQYQKIQKTQKALLQADLAAFHVVTVLFSEVNATELNQVISYFSTLSQQYKNLETLFPEQKATFRNLEKSLPQLFNESSAAYLQRVHLHLASSKNELDRLMSLNYDRLTGLIQDYRLHNDELVFRTLSYGIIGLILIGTITMLFFNRLKLDLQAILKRSLAIVKGYRGEALNINRHDELGQLCDGINYMSRALARREEDLEIGHRKYSFREKMIAVDSLAGGIAHEFGNPISCITGLVNEIAQDNRNQLTKDSQHNLNQLQHYAEGLVKLTRDLSLIDTNSPVSNDWLDLNQLLRNTIKLYRYDSRWSHISFKLVEDQTLPALFFSLNQFTLLMTQLLDNALEAVSDKPDPVIFIQTACMPNNDISLVIQDNGCGVKRSDLSHIFEPFFSTRKAGRGNGLGLAICWAMISSQQGTIQAESVTSGGLKVSIHLPVNKLSRP